MTMIPNPAALAALTSKPRIDQINLKLLQDYYKNYLNLYRFKYELADGFSFELDFDESRFCHLVGVESSVKGSVPERLLIDYRGDRGWAGIVNGTIDFDHLKKTGGKLKFNDSKIKFVHFYLLPKILNAPNQFVYYKTVVNRIQCDLMIFDVQENAYIHLGIEKGDNGIYVPRTFLIEKITPLNTGTKFIDPQPDPVAVMKTTVTNRNAIPAAAAQAPTASAASQTLSNTSST